MRRLIEGEATSSTRTTRCGATDAQGSIGRMMKRALILLVAATLAGGSGAAQTPVGGSAPSANQDPSGDEVLSYDSDETWRMTVLVDVDGRGPYPFIVDTGAERTVVARELAEALQLPSRGDVTLS